MVSLIVPILVPVAFVVTLGWLSGKWKILDASQSGLLAAFVVQFTLPADLFLAAARAKPSQIENWGLLVGLMFGFLVIYAVGLSLAVAVFHRNLAEGALAAMNGSFPNMAALGIPILGSLIGPSSLLSVLTGNLITSLLIVPATLTLLELGQGEQCGGQMVRRSLLKSLQQPLVWAPFAGIVFSLADVHLPETAVRSLELIGGVSPGVSLFSLGLLLSQQTICLSVEVLCFVLMKNLAQPALMGLLALLLAVRGEADREIIILGALPTASISAMLALRFEAYTAETSATVLLSTIVSVLTLPLVIALVQ